MHVMMKNYISILILLLFTSCGDFLDEYSQDLVVPKTITDLNEVILGSGYLPSNKVEYLYGGSICWQLNILDDDINTVIALRANKGFQEMNPVYYGYTTWQMEVGRDYTGKNLAADNANWDALYQRINAMNIILHEMEENIDLSTEQDRLDAKRLEGECLFLRGQFYLMLVNMYAKAYTPATAATELGVPLKLTHYVEHDKDKDTQFERASVAEVYAQIVKDLKESVACFKESPQTKSFYRASKSAALLLLSRVYLYMQDWKNAELTANELLAENNALLDLKAVADEGYAISEDSPELLFSQGSLSLANNYFSGEGGDFCISRDLYDLYDNTDYRQSIYFKRSTQTDSLGLNRKYKMGLLRSHVSDVFTLRTAEGYLNAAEACAMQGNAQGASDWLNQLRRKRIENYADVQYNADEVIGQVRAERRKELCLEGHRWFDLRRYAVCQKAPLKKAITRVYAVYDWDNRQTFKYAEMYELPADDPAYVFAIPKSVLEFDTGMPDNIREEREYVKRIKLMEE